MLYNAGPSPDGTKYIAMRDGTRFMVDLAISDCDSLGVADEEGQYSPAGEVQPALKR